jgi:hypothetical protein
MEIYRERAGLMNEMVGFVGEYISKEWVMRNIMRFSDEDLEQMQKEIDGEIASGEVDDPDEKEEEKPPVGKAPVKPTEPKKPTPPKKAPVPDDKKDEEPK